MKKIIFTYFFILSSVTFADQKWNSYYIGASAGAAFGEAISTDVSGYQGPESVGSELKYNTNGSQLNMFGGKNLLLSNNFLFMRRTIHVHRIRQLEISALNFSKHS